MNRQMLWTAIFVAASVTSGAAQNPPPATTPGKPGLAGSVWNVKILSGPKDSVIATYTLTIAADGKSGTSKAPNRDPIPVRIVVMAGDSLITESGPYASTLRPGQTVNLARIVAHYTGTTMKGGFEAQYSNGDVVRGKIVGTRAKARSPE